MKAALLVLSFVAAASAGHSGGGGGGGDGGEYGAPAHVPQTFRHVYVHSAPDEPEERQSRTIRVPGGDKHVNIIFVRTPSSSSSHQTEVILPEQDEHKNLVYVLLKKGSSSSDVKIRRPAAPAPQKPQVYFIRYGNGGGSGYSGGGGAGGDGGFGGGAGGGSIGGGSGGGSLGSQYGF